jgi:hypothetical protein
MCIQLGIKIVLDIIYKASIVLLACVVFLKNIANVQVKFKISNFS